MSKRSTSKKGVVIEMPEGGHKSTEKNSLSSVVEDNTPSIITSEGNDKRYNRTQRRNGAFGIQNNENGLFIQRVVDMNGEVTTFRDVALSQCSIFGFDSVKIVISEIENHAGNMNIDYVLIKADKKGKRKVFL